MKVVRRSMILWNLIIFVILSMAFFHVGGSDLNKVSSFSYSNFGLMKTSYLVLGVVSTLALFSLFLVSKLSKFTFVILVSTVFTLTVINLTFSFSKLILVLLFFYLVLSYFYYQFLILELNQASVNSGYTKRNLFEPMLYKINCEVELPDGKMIAGYLTNWDDTGCFLKLAEKLKLPKKFKFYIRIENEEFTDLATVVAKIGDDLGYGLKFDTREIKKFSWNQCVQYINELGYKPEILR